MVTVGIRELRQDASELIRRVEAGEEITVTVSGRPSARLVGVPATTPKRWRTWDEMADLFRGAADPEWDADQDLIGDSVRDPWETST